MIEPVTERLLVAGAALGDLDPAEGVDWAAHRAGCAGCRSFEGDLAQVLLDLALVVPQRVPPAGLLDAVRQSIMGGAGGPAGDPGAPGPTGVTA